VNSTCEKRVLVTGVFDVLHRGHIELLHFAAQHGRVMVGLNDDAAVRKLKGPTRPVNNEEDRLFVMNAINAVHFAFLIHSTRVDEAIMTMKPHYWVKGGDYTMGTLDVNEVRAANSVGAYILFFKTVPGHSTTSTIEKLKT